jgi:hypothetical protein
MKATSGALLLTTSGVAIGSVTLIEAGAVAGTVAAQVGPDTPVQGLTLGALMVAAVFAVGAVVRGGQHLVKLGRTLQQWQDALDGVSAVNSDLKTLADAVQKQGDKLDALTGWRAEVDALIHDIRATVRDAHETHTGT